jgi:hypothetical protein
VQGPIAVANLRSLVNFTGTTDETFFDNATLEIEAKGAPALAALEKVTQHVRPHSYPSL